MNAAHRQRPSLQVALNGWRLQSPGHGAAKSGLARQFERRERTAQGCGQAIGQQFGLMEIGGSSLEGDVAATRVGESTIGGETETSGLQMGVGQGEALTSRIVDGVERGLDRLAWIFRTLDLGGDAGLGMNDESVEAALPLAG